MPVFPLRKITGTARRCGLAAAADNRNFVYAGSSNLLDEAAATESLFTLTASVIDQLP